MAVLGFSRPAALHDFYSTFLAVRELRCPTIAAINGPAVGGGACMAMACDIRLAAASGKGAGRASCCACRRASAAGRAPPTRWPARCC